MQPHRILIIRFSSFGDILQAFPVVQGLRHSYPHSEIHWLTREDFAELVSNHPAVDKIHVLKRKEGFTGLLKLGLLLREISFELVYDAHNNLRSNFLHVFFLGSPWIQRPKHRWRRWLLFTLGINRFNPRFKAAESFVLPVASHLKNQQIPIVPFVSSADQSGVKLRLRGFENAIAIYPSAAWEMKCWPPEHYQELIQKMSAQKFVLLGGPQDRELCKNIRSVAPERVLDLSGQLSLKESCAVISILPASCGADTGLFHAADTLGRPVVGLMGPTAFGFPSQTSSQALALSLPCQPCSKDGRGRCKNKEYKACLKGILPRQVALELQSRMSP